MPLRPRLPRLHWTLPVSTPSPRQLMPSHSPRLLRYSEIYVIRQDNKAAKIISSSLTHPYSHILTCRSLRLSRHTVPSDLPVPIPALLVSVPRSPRRARRMPQQRKSKHLSPDFVTTPLTSKQLDSRLFHFHFAESSQAVPYFTTL